MLLNKLSYPKMEHAILGGIIIVLLMFRSQSITFVFNTMLGRALMVFFVLYLTHCSPLLGLGVTAIILILRSNMSSVEGLDNMTPQTNTDNMAATNDLINSIKKKLTDAQSKIQSTTATPATTQSDHTPVSSPVPTTTTTTVPSPAPTTTTTPVPTTTTTTTTTPAPTTTTTEGFTQRRHPGQDRISSEQNIRSKSSRSLLGTVFSSNQSNHNPSPNFPDNHGFSGLFGKA